MSDRVPPSHNVHCAACGALAMPEPTPRAEWPARRAAFIEAHMPCTRGPWVTTAHRIVEIERKRRVVS